MKARFKLPKQKTRLPESKQSDNLIKINRMVGDQWANF